MSTKEDTAPFVVTSIATTDEQGRAVSSQCLAQRSTHSEGWEGIELCQRKPHRSGYHLWPSGLLYRMLSAVKLWARKCACLASGRHKWLAYEISPYWHTYRPGDEMNLALVCNRCEVEARAKRTQNLIPEEIRQEIDRELRRRDESVTSQVELLD